MTTTSSDLPRLIPNGTCWCGCGAEVGRGAFFTRGHDKVAEGALLAARYGGSVAQLLEHHGFGPRRSVGQAAVDAGAWEKCPSCSYLGTPGSVRHHRGKAGH